MGSSKQPSTGPASHSCAKAGCSIRRAAPLALALACSVAGTLLPVQAASAAPAAAAPAASLPSYYEQVRAQLRWVPGRVGGREVLTPDPGSRVLLAKAAAERAGLAEVGLDFRDVYGVINAETSWFARDGLGRNGVTSQGLAQLEPATARALGVHNANDPVEAVHAAARLLKEAAQWSARRIAGLHLAAGERAARLREGISVYYNLSSSARERWNGSDTAALPIETQRHIQNVRQGAQLAERLAGGAVLPPAGDSGLVLAASRAPAPRVQRVAASRPAAPHPVGTIEWSGAGSDADGRRSGKHVVWSNGTVTREGGRVRWTSSGPAA
jgi:hypothetical protein